MLAMASGSTAWPKFESEVALGTRAGSADVRAMSAVD
jgi:hypothetical protein